MRRQKKTTDSDSDHFICIVGNNTLQNELLLSFLKKKPGLHGECLPKLEIKSLSKKYASAASKFFLIDCKSCKVETLWDQISSLRESIPSQCYIAFFNASANTEIEKMAMTHGINGIFFDTNHPQSISKGVAAILQGDLWYSRKSMTKILLDPGNSTNSSATEYAKGILTAREREVLGLIASGHNTREIAEELFVSQHTIKTHIYNIYGKINVKNRLQATLWAAKYL